MKLKIQTMLFIFMEEKKCYVNVKFVKKYVDFDYKVVKAEENLLQESV